MRASRQRPHPRPKVVLACLLAILAWFVVTVESAVSGTALRFAGATTTLAVNRTNGKLAVCQGGRLLIFDSLSAPAPALAIELPGESQAVREFRGNTVVYVTHGVADMPRVLVALMADGRERLAWPNAGISPLFPNEESHLTLDGRGIYGRLVLDEAVQELFALPDSVPVGAGVVATYRFAGEKLSARGSEVFRDVVALSPDDMVITLKDGGVMRYKAPAGVAWKIDRGDRTTWRLADVDLGAGLALVIVDGWALQVVDLEKGEVRWSWEVGAHEDEIAAWLGVPVVPAPASAPKAGAEKGKPARAGAAKSPVPAPTPQPRDSLLEARLLADGRVLLLGRGERTWLGVLDARTGRLAAGELLGAFARAGIDNAALIEGGTGPTLGGVVEARAEGSSRLLVRGAAGWYEFACP
jgi:hypothetical protein